MGDVDDEIRRAQQERQNLSKGVSMSAKSVSYDEDIYGGGGGRVSTAQYNTELDDDEGPTMKLTGKADRYNTESREVVRRALSSYTAPKHLLEHRPKADAQEEVDPMQEFKRKTVAEREDEYRARWRKRKLSPPRVMAFGKDAAPTEGARSYREIMMEQQLEKEKKEVMRKIQKKKEEEEENRKRDLKDKNHGTLWDVKEEGTERSNNPAPSSSSSSSSSSRSSGAGGNNWVMNVVKNGQRVGESIVLNPTTTPTFTIGRDRASNLAIDHPSCSKQHANITFKSSVPHITDLGSTNGTTLNDEQIPSHKAIYVKAGDTIKFGGSTREYTLFQQ